MACDYTSSSRHEAARGNLNISSPLPNVKAYLGNLRNLRIVSQTCEGVCSVPIINFNVAHWCSWLTRCPLKAEITGSSPIRDANILNSHNHSCLRNQTLNFVGVPELPGIKTRSNWHRQVGSKATSKLKKSPRLEQRCSVIQ